MNIYKDKKDILKEDCGFKCKYAAITKKEELARFSLNLA